MYCHNTQHFEHTQSCDDGLATDWSDKRDPSKRSAKLIYNGLISVMLDKQASVLCWNRTSMCGLWSKHDHLSFCSCLRCLTHKMYDPTYCCCTLPSDKPISYPGFWRYSRHHNTGNLYFKKQFLLSPYYIRPSQWVKCVYLSIYLSLCRQYNRRIQATNDQSPMIRSGGVIVLVQTSF